MEETARKLSAQKQELILVSEQGLALTLHRKLSLAPRRQQHQRQLEPNTVAKVWLERKEEEMRKLELPKNGLFLRSMTQRKQVTRRSVVLSTCSEGYSCNRQPMKSLQRSARIPFIARKRFYPILTHWCQLAQSVKEQNKEKIKARLI